MNLCSSLFAGITRRYYLNLSLRCRTGVQYSTSLRSAEDVHRLQSTLEGPEARHSSTRRTTRQETLNKRRPEAASPHPLQDALREHALQSTGSSSQIHRSRNRRKAVQQPPQDAQPSEGLRAFQASRQLLPEQASLPAAAADLEEPPRLSLIEAELRRQGIQLAHFAEGQHNGLQCPRCQGGESGDRSFSLRVDEEGAVWNCFRAKCGWEGGFSVGSLQAEYRRRTKLVKPSPKLESLSQQLLSFFESRGISEETLRRNQVQQERHGSGAPAIAFPYFKDGELVNLKYRTLDKRYWQVKGAEKVLYGYDDVVGACEVIIVEGEMDKLSLEEAGVRNVLSVPDGAPSKLRSTSLPVPEEDVKFSYIWNCRGLLERASRIILATDNDAPGQVLAQELARRLGPERCWLVSWSHSLDARAPPPKDANDVLLGSGPAQLQACIAAAQPFPISGLTRIGTLAAEMQEYYSKGEVQLQGYSTGWQGLDELYQVRPGCVTVLAGVPNAGKSEFADALLCNLAELHGLKVAVCSLERKASEHAKRLLEKRLRKPFWAEPRMQRMTPEDLKDGLKWLDEVCVILQPQESSQATIAWLLDLARVAVQRHGIQGLVIDSYSMLALPQSSGHSSAAQVLTQLREFAARYNMHIWLLVHSILPAEHDLLLSLADAGLIIQRSADHPDKVTLSVKSSRDAATARTGCQGFEFDQRIGVYHEFSP